MTSGTVARPLPFIRPITDLRTSLNDVCRQATETREPIVLTKNGTAAYVLMDAAAYDESEQSKRLWLSLKEAELEERYHPEPVSDEEAKQSMREIFALWSMDYDA